MGVYVCYDKTQRNFFRDKGIKDVVYGIHPKTNNTQRQIRKTGNKYKGYYFMKGEKDYGIYLSQSD